MSLRLAAADRPLVRAAGDRRLHPRAPDRAPPGHPGHDRRWAWSRDRRGMAWADRDAAGADSHDAGARSTRCGSGSPRPARCCPACRATARRWPRRGLRRSPGGRQRLSRHVALPVIAGATLPQEPCAWPAAGCPTAQRGCRSPSARSPRSPRRWARLAHPPGRARPSLLERVPLGSHRARPPAASPVAVPSAIRDPPAAPESDPYRQ